MSAYDTAVAADSPLAYWKLSDPSGTTVQDSGGGSHSGSYVGTPTLAATGIMPRDTTDTAVTFDGSTQWATVAQASWQNATTYSADAWIRPTSLSHGIAIASQDPGGGSNNRRYQFRVETTGALTAIIFIGTTAFTATSATGAININTVYHVAFTFDGTNVRVFINGSQAGITAASGSMNTTTVTDTLYLGRIASAGWSWAGKLEKIAIYGAALSAARVLAHYQSGAAIAATGSLGFQGVARQAEIGAGSLGVRGSTRVAVVAAGSLGAEGSMTILPATFPATPAPSLPGTFDPAYQPGTSPALHQPIRRASRVYNAATLDSRGLPVQPWDYASVTEEDWGWRRIVIDGTDRTYFNADNGMPTITVDYELAEPFGCGPGTLTALLASPYQAAPSWLVAGKAVDVVRLHPDGTTTTILWSGEISANGVVIDQRSRKVTCELIGDLWAGDTQTHKPPLYRAETDCGTVVPDTLNAIVNRRVNSISRVTTGVTTSARGASTDTPISFCQQLLATMTTDDGSSQWTIGRTASSRAYQLRLKDMSTVNWTVRFGQPGAQVSLARDPRSAPNRIYASGVDVNGYAWGNWKYPNYSPDNAPAYPFGSPSTVMTIGTTDGLTTSGTGVSDWQKRVDSLGIPGAKVAIDGAYSSQDAAACRIVQKAYGITIDGVVGPQTWAASFNVGANGGSLDGAFRMPLAYNAATMPRLYQADGSDAGANSGWDPTLLVVDRDEDMGAGISKAQAVRSAAAEFARNATPGLAGEIILTGDPREGSRFDVREGHNIKVLGFQGADVLVHIAHVQVSGMTVRLTVDERGRDLITLAGILTRDAAAASDPARMPARKYRRSVLSRDAVVDFDSESPAGKVPDFALFGGLWSVIHIPVSQQGTVAEMELTTHGPASPFVVAFFGDAVTANFMVSHVGANPLVDRGDGYGPFDWDYDNLLTAGFIEAIGGPGQAAGYDRGYQTSPFTGGSTPLTGKLRSTAGFQYRSVRPPWLWLAFFSPNSTRINGRMVPAPVSI